MFAGKSHLDPTSFHSHPIPFVASYSDSSAWSSKVDIVQFSGINAVARGAISEKNASTDNKAISINVNIDNNFN